MLRLSIVKKFIFLLMLSASGVIAQQNDGLAENFAAPPDASRLHAYWWWLNGNVTAEAITRDLEAMKEKGFGGALIIDAGGANQDGNRQVPKGPLFGCDAWRALYRHALREGMRLNMEMGLNIQSGWNLGGPVVKPADAAKILCWTEIRVEGPGLVTTNLPAPKANNGLIRDVAVVAFPECPSTQSIVRWEEKTLLKPVQGANYDTSFLVPAGGREAGVALPGPDRAANLTGLLGEDGQLKWAVPAGGWRVYRFCYTVSPRAHVSTCSEGWEGLAIDPMDAGAFQRYWDAVVEPLMNDAKALGRHTLKYLHTDSWEIEPFNWTPQLPEVFKRQCGYDVVPWLPVLAGRCIGGREASERFLHDYRKTVAELVAEGYYEPFLRNAHHNGMLVRAESGGPHGVPIDAQRCLGMIDVPMSEFWATSWRHRVTEQSRFFVKQPSSAAHTYGRKLVAAEGFTTIGPHWQERVCDNLKPNFDHALCEGLNQLVWTLVTCSPAEMGMPGQEMFPGTHFNPNSTWWRQSEGFLSYINRCQWMLQQGVFVADALYYYGDQAPNFAGLRASNPARLPGGYDYDVADEYVLLHRVSVRDGRLVLPDGMSYAALILPRHRSVSLRVLRKLVELGRAGAVIIGEEPDGSSGLKAWQEKDVEAQSLIQQLWERGDGQATLVSYAESTDWITKTALRPDFGWTGTNTCALEYIHRRSGDADIYFVSNPSDKSVRGGAIFRVKGKTPEFWNPVDGSVRELPEFRENGDGRIEVPIALDAFGSGFVVFRKTGQQTEAGTQKPDNKSQNFAELKQVQEIAGPWTVQFDPQWFYDQKTEETNLCTTVVFDTLEDWTKRPEDAVKYYSGKAVYRKTFGFPVPADGKSPATRENNAGLYLDLGAVREMARVMLNGKNLGVVWCAPWRVDVSGVIRQGDNQLEVEVVNFWPNRLIGDAGLRPRLRRTRTNITKFENPKGDVHYSTLMSSGLLGPVRLFQE